jgi:hypothetical protein
MRYGEVRHKSFLQSFMWVGVMLLAMGFAFFVVFIIAQLLPIGSEDIYTYINGELVPPTDDTMFDFRWIFLFGFGIPGLGLIVAGTTVIFKNVAKKKLAAQLKRDGACLVAEACDYADSNVSVNGSVTPRLVCAYTDSSGTTYIFKSELLRLDPVPYLSDMMVNVYYDQNDMSRYFVDIDGSVGLGSRLIEL